VFIKIGEGGTVVPPAERSSPLLAGRAMFMRIHVAPDAGFVPRRLRGVLTLQSPSGPDRSIESAQTISGPSDSEKLDSTFNFVVPADAVAADVKMIAAIYETGTVDVPAPAPASLPRFPPAGAADLGVDPADMTMEVVLVPVVGPSGPLDDSPARRRHLESYLGDVYPVRKMTVTWHDPLRVTTKITSAMAFPALQRMRKIDNAAPGAYYHMLLAAEDSTDKWLGLGEEAGPGPEQAASRIAMTYVTGHQVDSQMDTVSHEMGHNLGRNHAPGCGAQGIDAGFPYANTGVGVDGFSVPEMAFKSKKTFKDVMGYCYPTWISDYTWNGFAARIRTVSGYQTFSPQLARLDRSLKGYYAPRTKPHWVVVPGHLVPEDAPATPERRARISRTGGVSTDAPVLLSRLQSPAGPEDRARVLVVNLPPDGDVERVEIAVDGQRFVASGRDLAP
jgi:hypothetical protein